MENDKTLQPSYYSVTPAEVRYCKALGGGDAKHLYGEITALSNKLGYCFASNQYFADLYGVDVRTVQRWIALLEKHNFVTVLITGKNRRIYPIVAAKQEAPPLTEDQQPAEEEAEPAPAKKGKKTPKAKKQRVTLKFDAIDLELSSMLHERIVTNFPHLTNKKVDLEKWANDMRLLRDYLEQDDSAKSGAVDRIKFMIAWVQGGQALNKDGRIIANFPVHDFWAKNILSASKLRAQWDEKLMPQLQVWMQQKVKKHGVADLSNPQPTANRRPPERVAQL